MREDTAFILRFVNSVQEEKNSLLAVFNACVNNVNDF